MDVDAVWQWIMRLWFLIKAKEETEGHRGCGWERVENGGHFPKNQWVLRFMFILAPVGTVTFIPKGK